MRRAAALLFVVLIGGIVVAIAVRSRGPRAEPAPSGSGSSATAPARAEAMLDRIGRGDKSAVAELRDDPGGGAAMLPHLITRLQMSHGKAARQYASALAALAPGNATALRALLTHPDSALRAAARHELLNRIKEVPADVLPVLVESIVQSGSRKTQSGLLWTISAEQKMEWPDDAIMALLPLVRGGDLEWLRHVRNALARGGPKTRKRVVDMIRTSEGVHRVTLVSAAARMGNPGLHELVKLVDESEGEVREICIDALARQAPRVNGRLKRAKKSNDPAAVAELEVACREVTRVLRGAVNDPDHARVHRVVRALRHLDAADAAMAKPLHAVVAGEDDHLRVAALSLIGRLAPDTPETRALMIEMFATDDRRAHVAARYLIQSGESDVLASVVERALADPDWAATLLALLPFLDEKLDELRPTLEKARPVLKQALASEEMADWSMAARTLHALDGDAAPLVPMLVTRIQGDDRNARAAAIALLKQFGADAAPAIPALLAADDANARHVLAQLVPSVGGAATKPLIDALAAGDPKFRARCIDMIGSLGPDAVEATPALVRGLADDDDDVKRRSAAALALIGPGAASARDALEKTARETEDTRLRRSAIRAMVRVAPANERTAQALAEFLGDDARWEATHQSLTYFSGDATAIVPPLLSRLAAESGERKKYLAWTVGSLRQSPALCVPALIAAMDDDLARASAIRALGTFGADAASALDTVRPLLKSDDDDLRQAAAEALWHIAGDPSGIEARLRSTDPRRALRFVGKLGDKGAGFAPVLQELIADEKRDAAIRKAAGSALARVEAGAR
ncbi:MAG: HEAT repeat domain-containing protein [Planctomycetota bacterium]